MADVTQLPDKFVRLYKPGTLVDVSGIMTPGQVGTATETWLGPMASRGDFLDTVIGKIETITGFGGFGIIRRVPLRHPEYPFLLATGCRSRGRGWDGTLTSATHPQGFWSHVEIEVNFSSPNYDLSGQGAFLSLSGNPSRRPMPGSAAGFRIAGISPPFELDDGIDGEEFLYTTHQLPSLPMAVYDSVRNCANLNPFPIAGILRPAGTVVYRGPQYSQTNNFTTGAQTWEIAHAFSYSRVPWNNYYFTDGTAYAVTRADGSSQYPLVDITTVFTA